MRRAGNVYSGGWAAARGGVAPIVEPATGAGLGTTGVAGAADAADRAAVPRGAGALLEENADEPRGWVTRQTGAAAGLAGFAVGVDARERDEAAALASRSPGEVLPTTEPRLSLPRQAPVGVVGVDSPFDVTPIPSTRSVAPAPALGNAS